MFSSYLYSVIWTYHPRTQSTSGVILVRPKTSHNVRTDLEPWWEALRFQAGIIKHPLCLFIVTAMQVHHARTHGSLESQGQISHIERMTGFSPWSHETHDTNKPVDPVSVGLDELSLASRTIGAVLVSLEDHVRQLRSLRKAVEAYTQAGFTNVSSVKESADVVLALQVLSQHMDAWEIRLDYLQGRARNQLTVLFNLIARYDAASSMAIARSARRDSASMKVIAIMTMVFLPATFLAALFAVPSLRWDSSPVIQDNFWVYWAFAIPSTIAVFIFWLWLSGDGPTWRSLWSQPTLLKDESSASPTPTRSPSQRQWLSASITESLRRRAIAAKIPV
ncbi:hypothetical protein B0T16DRAFT_389005 [Cercophora newfieldiana]|uniref:Mg2+ transporter protein, CorA-like/Zinc transport protein ZntB n=1 Tax=Cercophora newfieldiana TaxID=92897 RepID=A0AA39YD62_9PEZI|nr:hypothetical protein B0T16DRAFT_389005 [Cercophora newfieldiana]